MDIFFLGGLILNNFSLHLFSTYMYVHPKIIFGYFMYFFQRMFILLIVSLFSLLICLFNLKIFLSRSLLYRCIYDLCLTKTAHVKYQYLCSAFSVFAVKQKYTVLKQGLYSKVRRAYRISSKGDARYLKGKIIQKKEIF